MPELPTLTIRTAGPEDYDAIRALTLAVYLGEELADDDYRASLADVEGRAEDAELLVARYHGRPGGEDVLLGTVAFARHGSSYAEITRDAGEAAFRMLAVDPRARGRGIGLALVRACLDRARAVGARRVVISTGERMLAAHRLYSAMGFRHEPERDWEPVPGIELRCLVLDLPEVEPPSD